MRRDKRAKRRTKERKPGLVSRAIARRNALVEDRITTMRLIWHDAQNAYQGVIADMEVARDQFPKESFCYQTADRIVKGGFEAHEYSNSIKRILLSKKVYFWKRAGVLFRAREALKLDRRLLRETQRLKSLPEIQNNKVALANVDHCESCIKTHIHKYRALFRRKLSFDIELENTNINKFIRNFLEARGEIRDKSGAIVKVSFEGENIPLTRIDHDHLLTILDNLLTDTLAHQENPEVRISTEERRGKIVIKFLNVDGEPIPSDVLPKIGEVQYSITGSPSKGLGKMSVNRIAHENGGWLDVFNSPAGPVLEVLLQPA